MDEVFMNDETPCPEGELALVPVETVNEAAIEGDEEPRRGGSARWLLQLGIGTVLVGGLVFGIGKRAELSSAMTLARYAFGSSERTVALMPNGSPARAAAAYVAVTSTGCSGGGAI